MLKFPCSRCKCWLLLLTFTTVILINCHIWYIYNNVCFYRGSLLLLTTIFIQSCQTQLFEFLLYLNIFKYYSLHRNKYSLLLENNTKEMGKMIQLVISLSDVEPWWSLCTPLVLRTASLSVCLCHKWVLCYYRKIQHGMNAAYGHTSCTKQYKSFTGFQKHMTRKLFGMRMNYWPTMM